MADEIVGDCGLLPCPVTPNLMRGRMFEQPLKPQCFIPRVGQRNSYLSVIILNLLNKKDNNSPKIIILIEFKSI